MIMYSVYVIFFFNSNWTNRNLIQCIVRDHWYASTEINKKTFYKFKDVAFLPYYKGKQLYVRCLTLPDIASWLHQAVSVCSKYCAILGLTHFIRLAYCYYKWHIPLPPPPIWSLIPQCYLALQGQHLPAVHDTVLQFCKGRLKTHKQ